MDTFDKVLASIIGLAILAVVVSKKAQTGGVIQSIASGISSIIGTAVSPVTGAATASTAAASSTAASSSSSSSGGVTQASALSLVQSALGSGGLGAGANASDIVNSISSIAGISV